MAVPFPLPFSVFPHYTVCKADPFLVVVENCVQIVYIPHHCQFGGYGKTLNDGDVYEWLVFRLISLEFHLIKKLAPLCSAKLNSDLS